MRRDLRLIRCEATLVVPATLTPLRPHNAFLLEAPLDKDFHAGQVRYLHDRLNPLRPGGGRTDAPRVSQHHDVCAGPHVAAAEVSGCGHGDEPVDDPSLEFTRRVGLDEKRIERPAGKAGESAGHQRNPKR